MLIIDMTITINKVEISTTPGLFINSIDVGIYYPYK
jgi:hypothetical protein